MATMLIVDVASESFEQCILNIFLGEVIRKLNLWLLIAMGISVWSVLSWIARTPGSWVRIPLGA
jgi:hypothetical protein